MRGGTSYLTVIVAAAALFCSTLSFGDSRMDEVLQSAESVFKSMKQGRYAEVWQLLSSRSRQRIVEDIYKGTAKAGRAADRGQIAAEMAQGGPTAIAYWGAFLQSFNPDMVLEQSKWEMGPIRRQTAEIVITYRKSEHPARLRLFLEDGGWKVGLVETFFVGK